MSTPLISTKDLTYRYGSLPILKGLDLEVPQGSIYGFLGPNGAGKTTTIRLLLGLLQPTGGNLQLFGQDFAKGRLSILQRIGALIETPSLYRHLSGKENLEVTRRLLGLSKSRIDHVLEIVQLQADAHRPVKQYSLGMCQRLGIALALLPDPELLILDEPTNGLDPSGIREMRELLISLNKSHGKTIFLSSHLLSEIEKTVTHVGILHQGRLSFQGSIQQLQESSAKAFVLEVEVEGLVLGKDVLLGLGYAVEVYQGKCLRVTVQDKEEVARLNQLLVQNGVSVFGLTASAQTLEEVFLSLTQVPTSKGSSIVHPSLTHA